MEVELTPFNRGHAGETEMRSFMIVVPDEIVDGATPSCERKERADMETFVVDGAEEALDLPIRLRGVGAQQVMADSQGPQAF